MIHKLKKISPTQWNEWVYIFAITCAFFFLHGYQSHEGDHAEHLPQVYRLDNPALFQGDYFLDGYDQQFNIRTYYVYTVYGLSRIVPLKALLFLLCFVCVFGSATAFFRISQHFFKERAAPYLALPLIFLLFFNFTLGGNVITYPVLICSTLGKLFAAWGLYYFLKENWRVSGLLLGAATLYQMLAGFQLFALLFGTMVLLHGLKPKKMHLEFFLSYLILGIFMLAPVAYGMFIGKGEYDKDLYYHILFDFKNSAHYVPSKFPITQYLRFIPLFLGGWFLMLKHKESPFVTRFFALGALGLAIYSGLFELAEWRTIGLTQWFKSTIWIQSLSCVFVAGFLAKLFKWDITKTVFTKLYAVCGIALLTIIFFSKYIPSEKFKYRYQIGFHETTPLENLHEWIKNNTPIDQKILVSPLNTGFTCQALRPGEFTNRAIVHYPDFLVPFYTDYQKLYNIGLNDLPNGHPDHQADANYHNLIGASPQEYPIRIVDLEKFNPQDIDYEVIHEEFPYALIKF